MPTKTAPVDPSAPATQARVLLERAAKLLKDAPDEYGFADNLIEVLAERMESPDWRVFRGAYSMLVLEEIGPNHDAVNRIMVDVAQMTSALCALVEGDTGGLDYLYHLDAVQRAVAALGAPKDDA